MKRTISISESKLRGMIDEMLANELYNGTRSDAEEKRKEKVDGLRDTITHDTGKSIFHPDSQEHPSYGEYSDARDKFDRTSKLARALNKRDADRETDEFFKDHDDAEDYFVDKANDALENGDVDFEEGDFDGDGYEMDGYADLGDGMDAHFRGHSSETDPDYLCDYDASDVSGDDADFSLQNSIVDKRKARRYKKMNESSMIEYVKRAVLREMRRK